MTRLLTTLRYDATLQWRNGFYYVTLMIAGFWALLLPQASALNLRWLMPAMVIGNLLIGTFFFLGGLILLEKDERTPQALRVTPLRLSEYLASKTITLALPALIETTLITGLAVSWRFEPLLLILGLSLAIVIYCLIGYIAVAQATSLNTYIIQAGGYSALLWIPLLAQLAGWNTWFVLCNPLGGPLMLVSASFEPVGFWPKSLAAGFSILWVLILAAWAHRRARLAS